MRFWREIAVALIVLGFLAALLITLYVSRRQALLWIHPARNPVQMTPDDVGLPNWETVRFPTPDGLNITAWFVPPKDKPQSGETVILIHGLGGHRGGLLDRAAILAEHGYNTLLIDVRNHGDSDGSVTTLGYSEVNDVRGAMNYLATRADVNRDRIGVLGHSMGGAIAIRAAAQIPEIRAVIAESSYQSTRDAGNHIMSLLSGMPAAPFALWFVDRESGVPVTEVSSLVDLPKIAPRPVLLIHGENDDVLDAGDTRRMFERAGEPKALYIVPGARHTDIVQTNPQEYEKVVTEFLNRYLRNETE